MTVTFLANELDDFVITPSSFSTGVETSYRFTLTTNSKMILQNSVIQISFPSEVEIANQDTTKNSCSNVSGFSDTITCSFPNAGVNLLQVSNGFASSSFVSGSVVFDVSAGVRNPRSTAQTLSFKVYVNDADGNGQYAIESGKSIQMTTASGFTAASVSSSSSMNGVLSVYTFEVTLSNVIVNGDNIKVVFPTEFGVSSVVNQCVGTQNLASSLICSVQGNNVIITVGLDTGVTQLPAVAGNTSTKISTCCNL